MEDIIIIALVLDMNEKESNLNFLLRLYPYFILGMKDIITNYMVFMPKMGLLQGSTFAPTLLVHTLKIIYGVTSYILTSNYLFN